MIHRYRAGKVRRGETWEQHQLVPSRDNWSDLSPITSAFESCRCDLALQSIWGFIWGCNQFVDASKPWVLVKDPSQAEYLETVLYHFAESLRIIAILISPVLPRAARGIFEQLNWKADFRLEDATWGGLSDGHTVGKPTPLFPRLEMKLETPPV